MIFADRFLSVDLKDNNRSYLFEGRVLVRYPLDTRICIDDLMVVGPEAQHRKFLLQLETNKNMKIVAVRRGKEGKDSNGPNVSLTY